MIFAFDPALSDAINISRIEPVLVSIDVTKKLLLTMALTIGIGPPRQRLRSEVVQLVIPSTALRYCLEPVLHTTAFCDWGPSHASAVAS